MVIIITNELPVATIPPNTPIKLKKIASIIIAGFDTELNWKIKMKNIKPKPVKKAPIKKAICLFCSSICPV